MTKTRLTRNKVSDDFLCFGCVGSYSHTFMFQVNQPNLNTHFDSARRLRERYSQQNQGQFCFVVVAWGYTFINDDKINSGVLAQNDEYDLDQLSISIIAIKLDDNEEYTHAFERFISSNDSYISRDLICGHQEVSPGVFFIREFTIRERMIKAEQEAMLQECKDVARDPEKRFKRL